MARALGIDPGTKSFDIVVIDNDKIIAEDSIPTEDIARDPKRLVEAIKKFKGVDIVAGPSGYGTPVICNQDIKDPRTFALQILLLTSEEQLRRGLKRGHVGIAVYKALADVVEEMWKESLEVCYIPSVILLPTVPVHRKLNKIDMGTADKLAVVALALHTYSKEEGISYDESSFIVVEMGYGYNAVMAVENGKVVDGIGGTLVQPGFLTAGSLDLEVVVAGGCWERSDVFEGGVSSACNTVSISEALKKDSALCHNAFKAMREGIAKTVNSIRVSAPKAKDIILSGRLTRYPEIFDDILNVLERIGSVRKLRGLEGASISKEAAQGYAIIGEGLKGGYFKDLIEIMEIKSARGTTLDWVIHPRVQDFKKMVREAYFKSVKNADRFL